MAQPVALWDALANPTRLIVVAALWMWVATPGTPAETNAATSSAVPETAMRIEFVKQVQDLVGAEKFEELENLARDLRQSRSRWPGGYPKLATFYYALNGLPRQRNETTWERHFELLQRWVSAKPDSVTARIAQGNAYVSFAWFARGGVWASKVSEEGWKLFGERLAQGRKILEEAEKLPTKDSELYCVLMTIAKGQSWAKPEFEKIFQRALAIDSAYYDVYFRKAEYLLPRWQGQPGEWARFAEEAAEMTKAEEGDALYARIIWYSALTHDSAELKKDEHYFQTNSLSWEKLKQGFLDLEKRHPNSLRTVNAFCYFACVAGDRETAHELFRRIGDRWDAAAWESKVTFEKWRAWADPNTPGSAREAKATFRIPTDKVHSIALDPKGQTLAVGGRDGFLALWDVAAGLQRKVLPGHELGVKSVAFSSDGKWLASGGGDEYSKAKLGEVKLWDLASCREAAVLHWRSGFLTRLAFAPGGSMLAAVGGMPQKPGVLKLWDVPSGKEKTRFKFRDAALSAVAFSPEGRRLAAGSFMFVAVWDIETGQPWGDLHTRAAHREWVQSVEFSPEGKTLATGATGRYEDASQPGELKLWDLTTGQAQTNVLQGKIPGVLCVAFSPDGSILAAGCVDQTVRLWDLPTGKERATLLGHRGRVRSLAFSADGRTLATGSLDGSVKLWEVSREEKQPADQR